MSRRRVAITGVSLVSSLGEGPEVHLAALDGKIAPVVDAKDFAPYPVHPLAPVDYAAQILKRTDLRQMGDWQRLGVYAAGLALQSAGLDGDVAAKDRLELLVAATSGERDHDLDVEITTGLLRADDPPAYLSEQLMCNLRPTLFLTQLSNMLTGNIAIVHGVTGGACTLLGEEQAGVDALHLAARKIAAGQSEAILVGAAYNAERCDTLLNLEFSANLHKGGFVPVYSPERQGAILGSVGAFLVLESVEAVEARGARRIAEISDAASGRAPKSPGGLRDALADCIGGFELPKGDVTVVSAASGVPDLAGDERAAIEAALPAAAITATGDILGHGLEASFPATVALGAISIAAGRSAEVLATSASGRRGYGAMHLIAPGVKNDARVSP